MIKEYSKDTIANLLDYINHPEKVHALFTECISRAMQQRSVSELLVLPVRFNQFGDTIIEDDIRFAPVIDMAYCKSTPTYEENGVVMYRLKLENNNLLYHGGKFEYYMDGDLDLSSIDDENPEDSWLPISEFSNIRGLLSIADFLLKNETAWQFTADHPESLCEGMIKAKTIRDELPPRWLREVIEYIADEKGIPLSEYISKHCLGTNEECQ